ncbi:hypothetical protein pipiens_011079 [Culex pipiens pipiens]|uniref:Uncharacterized protein n=1 Tax=Culex pipiens pipiens TaxID=38569 RepID=A0ABD1D7P5_CULPP
MGTATKLLVVIVVACFIQGGMVRTLTSMATDRTIPAEELFGQLELTFKKLVKTAQDDFPKYLTEIIEHMGCPVTTTIEVQFIEIAQHLLTVAQSVQQLKQAVVDASTRYFLRPSGTSGIIIYQVDVMSSSVLKIGIAFNKFAMTVTDMVRGIETANAFMVQILSVERNTEMTVKTARTGVEPTIKAAKSKALLAYYTSQRNMKADLSNAIAKLSIFSSSKSLSEVAKKYDASYLNLFQFLRKHNFTDVRKISKSYESLEENTDGIVCQVSDVLFGAMNRTISKLVGIVLERGPYADTCFTTFSSMMSTPYLAITNLIQGCITKEAPRWNGIADMINSIVSLLQANTADLSSNIGKCPTFANFLISGSDYT